MFGATYGMKTLGEYPTLKEAILALIQEVRKGLENRTLNYQLLESACWIERDGGYLYDFYQARDRAWDEGWIWGTPSWGI
jgi:hypothetical protein